MIEYIAKCGVNVMGVGKGNRGEVDKYLLLPVGIVN